MLGFFREVRVKGFDSMLARTLVAARTRLVRMTTELSNQIRGIMKTFGWSFPQAREVRLRRTFVTFLSIIRISLISCCRCWMPGWAFAPVPQSSLANCSWTPGLPNTHVHPGCRRGHRNLFRYRSKIPTTSGNPGLWAHG